MAARTSRIRQTDETRAKIQASYFIGRLTQHVKGEVELTNTQIAAIKILLDKSLPNLQDVRVDAGVQGVTFNLNQGIPKLPPKGDPAVIDVMDVRQIKGVNVLVSNEADKPNE